MNTSIALVAVAVLVFFVVVYFLFHALGTRLTAKQIEEDPDIRRQVDPEHRDEDFPIDTDY
jgi:uncharacterized protein YneF (UPF0154 family)